MISWGILGTGFMARMFAEDFTYVRDGKITAVASRTKDKADQFSKDYNIPEAYEGYENLVKQSDVDVVYIATPHSLHYENIKMCFANNKAVVCEKPITVNTEQLDEVRKEAKSKRLFLMEAMWTYFLPPIIQVKKWCDEKRIGDIHFIKAFFGGNADPEKSPRLFKPELAGGALLDLGIYPVAFSQLIMDCQMEKIQSEAIIDNHQVDVQNASIIRFKSGAIASIGSSINTSMNNDAYIYGTKGYIFIPNFFKAQKAYLYSDNGDEVFEDDRTSRGFNYEADEVNDLLIKGKTESNRMPLSKSLCNLSVLDTIREQIRLSYPFE
jgi:predicted dehydrogenase